MLGRKRIDEDIGFRWTYTSALLYMDYNMSDHYQLRPSLFGQIVDCRCKTNLMWECQRKLDLVRCDVGISPAKCEGRRTPIGRPSSQSISADT